MSQKLVSTQASRPQMVCIAGSIWGYSPASLWYMDSSSPFSKQGPGSLEVPQSRPGSSCHHHPQGPVLPAALSPCSTRSPVLGLTFFPLSQGPHPLSCSRQSPCLTLLSGSPGRCPSTPTGASPSTSWSCSSWGAPVNPSGSTPTAAPRPPRSLGASTPAPATSFVSVPTPMSQGNGVSP